MKQYPLITENQRKVIDLLHKEPYISLRGISKKMGWKGVANASFVIHLLERNGLIKIVGENTRKQYIPLTQRLEVINFSPYIRNFPINFIDRNGTQV